MLITSCLVVNFHYCGDFISEVAIILDANNCCCEEDGEEPSSCCDENSISIDIDDDHFASFPKTKYKVLDDVVEMFSLTFNNMERGGFKVNANLANAPPQKKLKSYILYKQFKVFS